MLTFPIKNATIPCASYRFWTLTLCKQRRSTSNRGRGSFAETTHTNSTRQNFEAVANERVSKMPPTCQKSVALWQQRYWHDVWMVLDMVSMLPYQYNNNCRVAPGQFSLHKRAKPNCTIHSRFSWS
eukprot:scaffold10087_cov166-Amphora_coffeaeformis.AAC.3